jgi:asparagine synthase (glutamine-hydrolysing)
MCGIAGYMGTLRLPEGNVKEALRRMGRRGPDSAAFKHWTGPSGREVYLLHSRLSIIDLDPRSNQPFRDGKRWMVFNGELYNYIEVRKGLEAKGEAFATSSDTEVLLRALGKGGNAALDGLEGMWAFAVYDEGAGTLTLCRDRFGEKPLFVYRDATGFYFGSEVKFITALLGRKLEVDVDHLCRYLVNGYKALYKQDRTFFKGLTELPARTVRTVTAAGAWTDHAYWEPRLAVREDMTFEEAAAGTRERLVRSMELRLRADVPLAFCMSGGVDSNALICTAKRVFGYDVHGFTVANTDERYEEKDLVDHVVKELGLRHTALPLETDGFLDKLSELVRYHDAPVYTITYFAHWRLMEQIAARKYRISVSGTAADELFTGYFDHHPAYLYEVRQDKALHAASKAAWEREVKPVVRNPHLSDPDLFIKDPGFRGHIYLNADEFSGYLKNPWRETFREDRLAPGLLRNRMMNEMFREAVPVILHEDDLNAMYYSIENRSPFLDRALFEFANTIPTRHLVKDGRAKAVLRESMRGIVPDRVLDSPRKVGFNAPIHGYLDAGDPKVRAALLADGPIYQHLKKEKIEALLDKASLPNSESKFLFYFLSARAFLEAFA